MNKIYNPKNIKPPVPTDVDEADSCMERYIRQKYQYRSLEDGKPKPPSREDASYSRRPGSSRRPRSPSGSPEGSPPPLPPKSGKFLGMSLRTSSSTSNLRRFGNKSKASPTADQEPRSPSSRKTTGLGAPVADVTTASFEAKMAALREMGFTNDRRNEMVLRGLNEDLDRSVETLVRLGEGNGSVPRTRTAAPTSTAAPGAGAVTPNPPRPETSTNPFDRAVSNPVPQQTQSTSYNPFDLPNLTPQSAQPLETSFQNLQVSHPLFPHSTGGYPNQASSMPPASYQQPFTPPVTSTFSQSGYISTPQAMDGSYNPFFQSQPQPQQQQQQPTGMGSQPYPSPAVTQNNPFFTTAPQTNPAQAQQQQSVPTLSVPQPPQNANTLPALSSNPPFGTSPFGSSPSFQTQQQPQQQQIPNAGQGSYNPFQQSMATTPQSTGGYPNQYQLQPQQQAQQFQQQPQQLIPQATGRMDKNSILSLYNLAPSQPPSIPSIPEQHQFQPGAGTSPVPPLTSSINSTPQTQPGSNMTTPQQQTNGHGSMASRNPFGAATVGSGLAAQAGVSYQQSPGLGIGMGTNGTSNPSQGMGLGMGMANNHATRGPPPASQNFKTHMSQPSVDVNNLQNGRHSPDAFASLSARYG